MFCSLLPNRSVERALDSTTDASRWSLRTTVGETEAEAAACPLPDYAAAEVLLPPKPVALDTQLPHLLSRSNGMP